MSDENVNKLKSVTKSNKLLPERVAEQLMELIRDRELQVGEKLPNEFEMAERLHVGRGTIREAVKILVSRNVVEIRRGCGTFVCEHPGMVDDPLGLSFVADKYKLALDLCEVRMIIEPEIAAMAAERANEEDIKAMEEAVLAVEELCKKQKPYVEQDVRFHEQIARSTSNVVIPNIISTIQSAIHVFMDVTDTSLIDMTIETHRKIFEAIKAHQPEEARAAMILHLQNNRDKIRTVSGLE